ncbi:leucine-rich repeat-containing protein 47-like [Argonauta hians]
MESMWSEVETVKKENRHELSLKGQQISDKIVKSGLDKHIYTLVGLNHLEISTTCLNQLGGAVGNLVNLTSLILCSNKLTTIPVSVGKLTKLKILDASNNEITSIPKEINKLTGLEVLNVNKNELEVFPPIAALKNLHKLNISFNQLKSLPEGITDPGLVHLSHILASNNKIEQIPPELNNLAHLNVLDLSENCMENITPELCLCDRLKELNLRGNRVKDRKLLKLLEQSNKKTIFEFLSTALSKLQKSEDGRGSTGTSKTAKAKKKNRQSKKDEAEGDVPKNVLHVMRFPEENGVTVRITSHAVAIRPYIICCIVKNVDLKRESSLYKKFIQLQTKLHDTVCDKRQAATIATHDVAKLEAPLVFDAKVPASIKLIPLFGKEEVDAHSLVLTLRKEADEIRKEKKRHKLSGVHKYLDFLHEKPEYPCLLDAKNKVISFPPITNSDITKITPETKEILVEVTSSRSLPICKSVMNTLLLEILNLGIGEVLENDQSSGDKEPNYKLTVQQVRILNEDSSLYAVYPSQVDIPEDSIEVIRD